MQYTAVTDLIICDNYQIKLSFENGSHALVNLKNRIDSVRFRQICDPLIFATAKINGDKICWHCPDGEFSVYVTELLESMLA